MDKLLSPDKFKDIDVSVGIVANSKGQLLVAKRPAHWLGGGFWEFPGGKIEPNEDAKTAMKRELLEEVGIIVHECTPLINLVYVYPERKVSLNAWVVDSYSGEPAGLEGQEIRWCDRYQLDTINMLPANRAIVIATQLPDAYLITPECHDRIVFLQQLRETLQLGGIKLMLLRSKQLSQLNYLSLAEDVAAICEEFGVFLMLNHQDITITAELPGHGIQLTAEQLLSLETKPSIANKWISASCHNEVEVRKANDLALDFITLSPVLATPKYQTALGWQRFAELVTLANVPVFALGGLTMNDIPLAKQAGAQGVAAIRSLWVSDYSKVS